VSPSQYLTELSSSQPLVFLSTLLFPVLLHTFINDLGPLCAGHLPGHLLDLSRLADTVSAELVMMPGQAIHTSQTAHFAHPGIAGAVLLQGAVTGFFFLT